MNRRTIAAPIAGLRILTLIFACVLLGLAVRTAEAAPAEPAAPGSIAGTVRDADNMPLPNIRIDVHLLDGQVIRSATTDANGTYRAPVLPAGAYRVEFSDPAGVYARQYYAGALSLKTATELPVLGQEITGINATLALGGSISGTITAGDLPLTNPVGESIQAVLYAKTGDSWAPVTSVQVDDAGAYQFEQVQPGAYRVCANYYPSPPSFQYYSSCYDRISAGVANATDVLVQAAQETTGIDIRFGDETDVASLAGVVSSAGGAPLADIDVQAQAIDGWTGSATQTDALGQYVFNWLPPGAYRVRFSDTHGFAIGEYYADAADPRDARSILLAPGEVHSGVDAELAEGGRVTGTVTLLGEVKPLYGVVQALAPDDPYASPLLSTILQPGTDQYVLAGLPPGRYKISAHAAFDPVIPGELFSMSTSHYYGGSDFDSASIITVTAGATASGIDFVYGDGVYDGVLQGVVMGDGAPAAGIRVELYAADSYWNYLLAYTTTDADGAYRIEGLTSRRYRLVFRDPTLHFAYSAPPPASVQSGEAPVTVDAQLVPGGIISGQLRRRDGSPAPGSPVSTLRFSELSVPDSNNTTSAADGSYHLRGLVAGDYLVCATIDSFYTCYGASDPGGVPQTGAVFARTVDVVAGGEITGIDISLEPLRHTYLPAINRE